MLRILFRHYCVNIHWKRSRQGQKRAAAWKILNRRDVKSRSSGSLLRPSLSPPRCRQPHSLSLSDGASSRIHAHVSQWVWMRLSLVFEPILMKKKEFRGNKELAAWRQLRDAVLPFSRAAETDNNPERCRLSGCSDRPPTNHCTQGIETFPRVGQSSLIEDCYHRDPRRLRVWNHVVYSRKKKKEKKKWGEFDINRWDRMQIEIFNHSFNITLALYSAAWWSRVKEMMGNTNLQSNKVNKWYELKDFRGTHYKLKT